MRKGYESSYLNKFKALNRDLYGFSILLQGDIVTGILIAWES
jgi:hypothetical protein